MKKVMYYCDRCGKPLEKFRFTHGIVVWRRKLVFKDNDDNKYDLCQSCYDDMSDCFRKFDPDYERLNKEVSE